MIISRDSWTDASTAVGDAAKEDYRAKKEIATLTSMSFDLLENVSSETRVFVSSS